MPVLPERAEAEALVPPRGGVTWRISGDSRVLAGAGYALLLQVSHPSVGAGVSQHSDFKRDPWGRLLRTLDYTSAMVFGGPDLAWKMGRRVRGMHTEIKGVRPDGERYHALEPGPYAWVHATLADAIISAHRAFCSPQLSPAEVERFWAEWLRVGRLIGVGDGDLPPRWPGLVSYVDEMVERELGRTEAVGDVLEALSNPASPLPWPIADGMWRLLSRPGGRAGALATVGLLPPVLRERFGIEWTERDAARFERLAALSRRARPVMPPPARNVGPYYLRLRRLAIARGRTAAAGAK